jgi:hypothetical protein
LILNFKKRNFCYTVFDNPDRQNIIKIIEILRSHPNKATDPFPVHGAIDGVAVHLKYTDENDLTTCLQNIKNSVVNTSFVTGRYLGYFASPNKERYLNLLKLGIYVFIITFISYFGLSIKQLIEVKASIPYEAIIVNGLITASVTTIVTVFTIKAKKLEALI